MICEYCEGELGHYKDHVGKYECEPACGKCVSKYRMVYDRAKLVVEEWLSLPWEKVGSAKQIDAESWHRFNYDKLELLIFALRRLDD